jgi:hypothetical protein
MIWRAHNTERAAVRAGLTFAALTLSTAAGLAQGVDCSRLQSQIASIRSDPSQSQRFLQLAERQQVQLDRTMAYAQSLGCQNHQFLFFGSPPPPQCQQINPQIARMQANLQRLQQQAAGGDGLRRELTDRYNSYCGNGSQASLQGPRNFFEQLFGGGGNAPPAPTTETPINPEPETGSPIQSASGGSKAVCVRTCDGGFFPVSYTASPSQYDDLQAQCSALCPNVQTELFTYPGSGVIDQAVSANGQPYSSLPNAGLYRTKYDPACTCRPPHQSWAQALAGAEKLVGDRPSDIIVTPEKSEEMARAVAADSASLTDKPNAGGKGSDATDGQTTAASDESADIAGSTAKDKFYGENQGRVVEEVGPNGVKRRVRIVGP